jgi:hypothetical protein
MHRAPLTQAATAPERPRTHHTGNPNWPHYRPRGPATGQLFLVHGAADSPPAQHPTILKRTLNPAPREQFCTRIRTLACTEQLGKETCFRLLTAHKRTGAGRCRGQHQAISRLPEPYAPRPARSFWCPRSADPDLVWRRHGLLNSTPAVRRGGTDGSCRHLGSGARP